MPPCRLSGARDTSISPRRGFEKKKRKKNVWPKGEGEKKGKRNGKKEGKEESGPINTQTRGGCRSIFTFVLGNHGGVCRLPCEGSDRFGANRLDG